jgi:hypothetical protein
MNQIPVLSKCLVIAFFFSLKSINYLRGHVNDIGDKETWKIHWPEQYQDRCKNITEQPSNIRLA